MDLNKKSSGVISLIAASLVLMGCFQNEPSTAPVVEQPKAQEARVEEFVEIIKEILGDWVESSNVRLHVNTVTGDSSVIVSRFVDKVTARRGGGTANVAFKLNALKEYKLREIEGDNGYADPNKPLTKSAQARWRINDNEVKHLAEVTQIKVYFEVGGGSKMKPNWASAAREAIAKWNAMPGTQVSFVEIGTPYGYDIRLKCAILWDGSGATTWLTPDPWVIGDSVEIYYNLGFESTIPHHQKVVFSMLSLANIINITHTGNEGGTWVGGGVFVNIDETPYWDPSTVFQPVVTSAHQPIFSEMDIKAVQQLYPAWGALAKNASNELISSAAEGTMIVANNVKSFQTIGDTLFYLRHDGSFWRRIGTTGTNTQLWSAGSGAIDEFVATDGWVAVKKASNHVIYTRKFTAYSWTTQPSANSGPSIMKIAGEKLAVHYLWTGNIYTKYLASNPGTWNYEWSGGVVDFAVSTNRLAVASYGDLWVKDEYGNWNYIWGSYDGYVQKVLISANNFAIFVDKGYGYYETYIRADVWGTWGLYGVPGSLDGADLCGSKFAVINYYGGLYIYDGYLGLSYSHASLPGHGNTAAVRLSGPFCDYVSRLDAGGALYTKYSIKLVPHYLWNFYPVTQLQQRP